MPSSPSSLATMHSDIKTVIENDTPLTLSRNILDVRRLTNHLQDRVFSINITTNNSNKYRDKDKMRLSSTVEIGFINRINMNDEVASQTAALQIADDIILAMCDASNFPSYRVLFVSSNLSLTQSNEHIFTRLIFSIESDYAI